MNESLTPSRILIFNTLRSMKRAHPSLVKGCSTYDGRVYAYTKPVSSSPTNGRDQRHLMSTMDGLDEFCPEYVKLSHEKFSGFLL